MPLAGLLVSCPFQRQPCPVRGLSWVVLPVRQLCPLWDTTLMHITISALPLARLDCIEFNFQSCLPDYFTGFTFSLQPCQLPEYQFITLPLVRVPVYNTATCQSTSLQHCHLPEYQFTTLPLVRVPVYNTATCQGTSLQHCHLSEYQFITLPLVRLYYIDFSYQLCHLPDFIALLAFYRRATCQTLFSWFQFTVLPLVRPCGIGFSLQPCHRSVFISFGFSLQS